MDIPSNVEVAIAFALIRVLPVGFAIGVALAAYRKASRTGPAELVARIDEIEARVVAAHEGVISNNRKLAQQKATGSRNHNNAQGPSQQQFQPPPTPEAQLQMIQQQYGHVPQSQWPPQVMQAAMRLHQQAAQASGTQEVPAQPAPVEEIDEEAELDKDVA